MYVLVRKDLTPPQQAVQACHAVIELTKRGKLNLTEHPHLVLCGVRDEPRLIREMERLQAAGVSLTPFYEPDRGSELTAVAAGPIEGAGRRIFRRYQLIKEKTP